jgi:MHS family proline/betaine transporter-like MFS transporter
MVQLYPVEVRSTAISVTYNLANALFGGLSPLICLLFVSLVKDPLGPVVWILGAAGVSLISILELVKIKAQQEKTAEILPKAA